MADVPEALATLRPDRWPAPPAAVSGTDVAFALLAGALAGLLVALAVGAVRRRRPATPRRTAIEALRRAGALPPEERLAAEAGALRAFAAARLGPEAARSEGEAWLAVLDRLFATRFFSEGAGRRLADGLYAPGPAAPLGDALVRLLRSAKG